MRTSSIVSPKKLKPIKTSFFRRSRPLPSSRPNIESRPLRGRPTTIFENHATAVLPWAELREEADEPMLLVTLDHHTDTNPAYLRSLFRQVGRNMPLMEDMRQERIHGIDRISPDSMLEALDGLYHDEHIDVAIRTGIFERAFVIQLSHHEILDEWEEQAMTVFPTELDCGHASEAERAQYYDLSLEDSFLSRQLNQIPTEFSLDQHPYVLDIDLDYFKTKNSMMPNESTVIKELIDGAVGVTIAKESEWVQRLFLGDEMKTDEMLELLYTQLS